jgi:uncharacterized membrane protein
VVVGAKAPATRVAFLDALRFVAAFQMIQGHSIAATLAPEHRHGAIYALWFAARGLTSVAFLFTAGFAFFLTSTRDYARRHRSAELFRRRGRRALMLLALGYALHAPFAAWSADPRVRAAAWRGFVAVDVLQCIGITLLVLQVLTWLLPRAAWLGAAAGGIACALFALTPLTRELEPSGAWAPVLSYLSPRAGSLFPLLPWAAHMFAGAACGAWLLRERAGAAWPRLLGLGAALVSIAGALAWLGVPGIITEHVGRLGRVVLVTGVFAWSLRGRSALPAFVRVLASETLFLYAFHVLLAYGAGLGLADRVGPRLGPGASVGCAVLVLAASLAPVLWYRRAAIRGRPAG